MAPRKEKSQRQRFIEAAREAGASEDPLEFERALRGVAKAPPTEKVQERKKARSKSQKER